MNNPRVPCWNCKLGPVKQSVFIWADIPKTNKAMKGEEEDGNKNGLGPEREAETWNGACFTAQTMFFWLWFERGSMEKFISESARMSVCLLFTFFWRKVGQDKLRAYTHAVQHPRTLPWLCVFIPCLFLSPSLSPSIHNMFFCLSTSFIFSSPPISLWYSCFVISFLIFSIHLVSSLHPWASSSQLPLSPLFDLRLPHHRTPSSVSPTVKNIHLLILLLTSVPKCHNFLERGSLSLYLSTLSRML